MMQRECPSMSIFTLDMPPGFFRNATQSECGEALERERVVNVEYDKENFGMHTFKQCLAEDVSIA